MNARDTAIANACLQSIENFCMRANPETFRAELEKQGYVVVPREQTEAMVARVNAACDVPNIDLSWTWPVWLSAAQEPQP